MCYQLLFLLAKSSNDELLSLNCRQQLLTCLIRRDNKLYIIIIIIIVSITIVIIIIR